MLTGPRTDGIEPVVRRQAAEQQLLRAPAAAGTAPGPWLGPGRPRTTPPGVPVLPGHWQRLPRAHRPQVPGPIARELARHERDRGLVPALSGCSPEPGPSGQQLVEPGRAVRTDPPRAGSRFPRIPPPPHTPGAARAPARRPRALRAASPGWTCCRRTRKSAKTSGGTATLSRRRMATVSRRISARFSRSAHAGPSESSPGTRRITAPASAQRSSRSVASSGAIG